MKKQNLTIIRKENYADYFRKYKIYIDDGFIGEISRNSSFNCKISNNAELYLKIDWCKSNKIIIDDSFSDDINIEVFPTARSIKFILYFYYITFGFNKYLTLKTL